MKTTFDIYIPERHSLVHKQTDFRWCLDVSIMLGDRICQAVLKQYHTSPQLLRNKNSYPVARSNGIEEWTILASVVAVFENGHIEPLSLATGMKAVPSENIENFSNGVIVHDLHAEILALRAFNYFLLEEVNSNSTKLLLPKGEKFKLKDNISLALYISEVPCGDCSMENLQESVENSLPWEDAQQTEPLRGRSNMYQVGRVRTKPGRVDSRISLSKSCSDKLTVKQSTGITNTVVHTLIEPIFLTYLVVPEKKINMQSMERCFGRVEGNKLNILPTRTDFKFEKVSHREPCHYSVVFIPTHKKLDILCLGVKNGGYQKNKPAKRNSASFVSRLQFVAKLRQVKPDLSFFNHKTYSEAKKATRTKDHVTQFLGWFKGTEDDFLL